MKQRDFRDYFQDILDSIQDIESFIGNMSFDQFMDDRKTINAVIRSLEVIGEAVKNIPESIRIKFPEIPWKKMAGMRDKMIHEYFGIDMEIVWKTIKSNLPPLKPLIIQLLDEQNNETSNR